MTNQLPNGWINVTLGELGRTVTGKTPSTKIPENFNGSIPFIKPSDLDNGGYIHTTTETLSEKGLKCVSSLPVGSITVTCIGNLGKTGITTKISATNQQINSVICDEKIHNKYIYYFLTSMRNWLEHESSATTISIVNKSKFSLLPVKLPPLAEQKEIATLLDNLLAQVDTLKTRLDAIPNILKRFRRSVLAAAVSGKLTGNEITIRNNWKTIEFSELLDQIRSGSADKPSDENSGIPILRSSAIRDMAIDYSDIRYLDGFTKANKENYLRKHDLIFTRLSGSAEYVGNCAVVKSYGEEEIQYPDRLFCARLKDKSHALYLEFFFSSSAFKNHISDNLKSSAGHQRITLDVIKKAIVFLPPIEEQEEIVLRVEELFAFADQIEQRVKVAQQRVNHLTQAILAKAFRGELTAEWREQNPDLISGENSAAALLARIKTERKK
jgi:type I restriction enzyme S subunit